MSLARSRRRQAGLVSVVALVAGIVLAACGGSSATPTPVPTPSAAPSTAPSAVIPSAVPSAASSPASVGSPAPVGSPAAVTSPAPVGSMNPAGSPVAVSPGASAEPTPPDLGVSPDRTLPPGQATWPTSVVSAAIALAAADKEFQEAVVDWQTGGQEQDMELLLAAAQGMAFLAEKSIPNAQRLADFPELATAGQDLVDAFSVVMASGQKVAETALAGDAAGFESAVTDLGAGMAAYATARGPMIEAAELALVMRRGLLVK